MNDKERRIFLLDYLLKEGGYEYKIPTEEVAQRNLLRALMNVRLPSPLSAEFIKIQDEYLKNETLKKGITAIEDLSPVYGDIYLWQGDITTIKCDAIVNAANSQMLGCFQPLHNCIDNCIHSAAGLQLRNYCNDLMLAQGKQEPTGKAKITPAFNLPCRYVIHTVGPIVCGTLKKRDKTLLADCYENCLKIAEENNLKSIAFCCISTGVFGFPQQVAAKLAVKTVNDYKNISGSDIKVIFNVFKDTDLEIYRKLLFNE